SIEASSESLDFPHLAPEAPARRAFLYCPAASFLRTPPSRLRALRVAVTWPSTSGSVSRPSGTRREGARSIVDPRTEMPSTKGVLEKRGSLEPRSRDPLSAAGFVI